MTPEAKKALSSTIRGLRERLLADLHSAMDSEYLLSVRARDAGLGEAATRKRQRLEAWLDEQVAASGGEVASASGKPKARKPGKTLGSASKHARTREDFRREVEQQAAYTLLNRLVLLRLLEAAPSEDQRTSQPLREKVVTGGWESPGYKTFRELAPAICQAPGDASEGYAFLLDLVYQELAQDLPGLFDAASAGMGSLVPVPASTLRHVVEALDKPELASCWQDDMTLGWVYQYWNDPEREALDAKLNARQKLEPHEIASKTQMFTERYMVDWLLQNSLGPMWLAICAKNKWTPEVEQGGVLAALEARRVDWRGKRERGEVSLTELMPLHSEVERRWAYYVPQPLPEDAVTQAPASVRGLKILDPAVGSGHFLVVAFDLLVALYHEEARHRGIDPEADEEWSTRGVVERILEDNLHGIDLDPRAVQIAAAALWLKARQTCAEAQPKRLGLVASNLRLASLPDDHPALVELRAEVERETGIPAKLTDTVLRALAGADHLGSLLRVDEAVEKALDEHERALSRVRKGVQGGLFDGGFAPEQRELISRDEAKETILARLEGFLKRHTRGDDLGLRLRGEQLAAGVRFVRMVREGTYDLVVGNPPYQGTKKLANRAAIKSAFPLGRANLFACFIVRGLELLRSAGTASMAVPTAWMYSEQYEALRADLISKYKTTLCADLGAHAFQQIGGEVVTTSLSCWTSAQQAEHAIQVLSVNDGGPDQKAATCLARDQVHQLLPTDVKAVPGYPLIYRWSRSDFDWYSHARKFSDVYTARYGTITGDDLRFLRNFWEVSASDSQIVNYGPACTEPSVSYAKTWYPYIKGAAGQRWYEPVEHICKWSSIGLECKVRNDHQFGSFSRLIQNEGYNFTLGIAFTSTGTEFGARLHRAASVIGAKGRSIFGPRLGSILCLLNSRTIGHIMGAFNPSLDFNIGDVARLPLYDIADSGRVVGVVSSAFTLHESHREPSVEFRTPGPSPWRHAQAWAQLAVDRPENTPLPDYTPELDPEPPTDHLSYALGVALGRFGPAGEGILDPTTHPALIARALPAGILFLDTTLDPQDLRDSLGHPAAAPLLAAWDAHGPAIAPGTDLRAYLSASGPRGFFELHRKMYESRPIHWPLASENRTFVAWVTIHRWDAQTLRVLLADHLRPTLTRVDGELADLRAARDGDDKKAAKAAERRLTTLLKAREELAAFVAMVEQCAEKGPPSEAGKATAKAKGKGRGKAKADNPGPRHEREVDARYDPDLDDGVMINSAALWPLLLPLWKEPQKWWGELAAAAGKKDYDWAHLAMRYWPTRVDQKCQQDPSLAVAHGCFWKYHPKRAWAWELRLQDEIGQDFRIDEALYRGDGGSDAHRTVFLADHPIDALEIIAKEALRRVRKHKRRQPELRILEPGLWTERPGECWALEETIIEKQEADFRLLAPDEPEARAALLEASPKLEAKRRDLLERLVPTDILIGDDDDEGASDDDGSDDDADGEEDDA